jgi:hypothetical protein
LTEPISIPDTDSMVCVHMLKFEPTRSIQARASVLWTK